MECLRCGANLKDDAKICTKCGFIMKGARRKEDVSAEATETTVATKAAPVAAARKVKPVAKTKKSFSWPKFSLLVGILACTVGLIVPGFNVCFAAIAFVLAFVGFGKASGEGNKFVFIGIALCIVAIFGSWAYNVYVSPIIGEMLGTATPTF